MVDQSSRPPILIINPNTTEAMTEALRPLISNLSFTTVGCQPKQ